MKLSIQSKIQLYIIFPLLVIFLAFLLITENLVKKEELASIDRMMSIYTADLADKINAELHDFEMIAYSGADFISMSEFVNDDEAYAYLETNQKKSGLILGSRFAFNKEYNNGKVRVNSISMEKGKPVRAELSSLIKFSEDWYQIPTTTMKPHWSEPFIDRETKVVCARVSVPILKKEKIIGVASARVDLTKFKTFVDTSLYKTINFVIVSKQGQFIYHPDNSRILRDNILAVKDGSVDTKDLNEEGQKMLQGISGKASLRLVDESGDKLLAYYSPIKMAGWSVSVFVNESEILAKSHNRRKTSLIIGFFTALLFLLIARQLSKRITKPLSLLSHAITKISESKEYKNVEITSNDELSDLARSFNDMTEAIHKNEKELQKLNEELEGKVEERTQSLEETLQKLGILNSRLKAQNMAINAAAIVSLTDIKGNITEINEEFLRVSKYSREELIGQNHRILNSGFHPKEFFGQMWKTIASGHVWRGQVRNKAKDGSIYWVDSVMAPIIGENGKPVEYLSIRFEITEMMIAEQELQIAKAEAEQANSAKSEFLARMSHEIRTPMNAIIGMTYLTLKTDLNEKQRDNLNKVHSSGIALLNIINDILDFSKIESGKLEIEHSEFNLEKVFNDLSTIVTYKAHEKGLEFVIGLSPGIPPTLIGDSLRLNQILINLANNAIKFTSKGEIIIKAEIDKVENDRIKILFTVKDSGIGLTEQQTKNLFKSFSQADASTTRKYGGTGLGLAISKSLTELMGGEIWVESKEGKGSTFFFTSWFELSAERNANQLLPAVDLRGMKVLVCDDNITSCEILKEALESFSFKVVTVTSGKEALIEIEKHSEDPFELVLMDWHMPEMNGLEAVRLIKSDKKIATLPIVIMVTAYNSFEVSTEAEKIGIANTLIKPVSYSTLFNTIMESFGKKVTRKQSSAKANSLSDELKAKLNGASVLLVEDNEINQDVAIGLLKAVGINADIASNGRIAVEMVQASGKPSKYDLIIMDLQMPEMDGYEASRRIKMIEEYKDLPIFAMTADAVTGVKENCFKAGMIDFVSKPIVPEKLYSVLSKWITRKADGNEMMDLSSSEQKQSKPIPPIEGINIEEGLNRMNHNTELYLNLLKKFSKNYSTFVSELRGSFEKETDEESKRMVHTLKGVAGNIGAESLHQFMIGLDTKIKSPERIDITKELADLENMLKPLLASINQVLMNGNKDGDSSAKKSENEVDEKKIRKVLDELKPLLVNNDFEASVKSKYLQDLARNSKFSEDVKKINDSIANYDFDEALNGVNKLLNNFI